MRAGWVKMHATASEMSQDAYNKITNKSGYHKWIKMSVILLLQILKPKNFATPNYSRVELETSVRHNQRGNSG